MKKNYHIEYDLPLDQEGDDMKKVKALAGDIVYIMDDILNDMELNEYNLELYYHLINSVLSNRILILQNRRRAKR